MLQRAGHRPSCIDPFYFSPWAGREPFPLTHPTHYHQVKFPLAQHCIHLTPCEMSLNGPLLMITAWLQHHSLQLRAPPALLCHKPPCKGEKCSVLFQLPWLWSQPFPLSRFRHPCSWCPVFLSRPRWLIWEEACPDSWWFPWSPTLVSTSVGCNVLHTPLMWQHALPSTAFCFFFYLWKFFPKKIKFVESRDLVIACHISKVNFFFLVRQDRI